MPTTNNLYPPIVPDAMPAFIRTQTCRVYFSLSQYNNPNDIKNVQISIVNQNTNQSALKKVRYPSGIKLAQLETDNTVQDDYKYYVQIVTDETPDQDNGNNIIISNNSDLQEGIFGLNQFYKVQLRFTSINAPTPMITQGSIQVPSTGQEIATWLQDNLQNFSEWSTVCLIKGIEEPIVSVNWPSTFTIIPEVFSGKVDFGDIEKETLKSYHIKVQESNGGLTIFQSQEIYTNQFNPNEFSYQILYDLEKQVNYTLEFAYTTINLYHATENYNFIIDQNAESDLKAYIEATPDEDNGRVKINIEFGRYYNTTNDLIILRSSATSNFHQWTKLKTIKHTNDIRHLWYDTTIESGVWYKYRVLEQDDIMRKMSDTNQPVMCMFQDIFLTNGKTQLKVQFNPTVSDFKYNVTESQQVTLGSVYPYVKRNGNNYFRSFNLSGLISALMDEEDWYYFDYRDGHFLYKNKMEPFATPQQLYGVAAAPLYKNYNQQNNIDRYQDYIYEREFRKKVTKFLYENNIKLFRSLTEGNILIKLTNISFQPVDTLGRRLYSFSAVAIEIGDYYTIQNLFNYNIINKTYYTYAVGYLPSNQLYGTFESGELLLEQCYETIDASHDLVDIMQLNFFINNSQEAAIYAKIKNNKEFIRYVTKNQQLELNYGDNDPIAECYFYGIHFNDYVIEDGYYNFTSQISNPIANHVYYITENQVYLINRYINFFAEAGLLNTYEDETVLNQNNNRALLVQPSYYQMIYYNNNWYLFTKDHDIILDSISAKIKYTYRIKKEE